LLASSLAELTATLAPASTLARVQQVWSRAMGASIAAAARPTAERDGVLTVTCEAAVWAQELDLMAAELVDRLNGALPGEPIRALRCRTG
jgi:predicted nucleic acid-binding Zn ribbon protein